MKLRWLFLRVGLLTAIGSLHAGPPFVTDDPEPPAPSGWEINLPFIIERTPGKTEIDAPLFDFNYGLPDVQLKLELPVKIVHEDGNGTVADAGDLLLGLKWRFLNNKQSHLQLGIYPQLLLPTGIRRAASAKVDLRSCCRSSHKKVGRNGRFTGMAASGGKRPPERATTFMPAQYSSVKSTSA